MLWACQVQSTIAVNEAVQDIESKPIWEQPEMDIEQLTTQTTCSKYCEMRHQERVKARVYRVIVSGFTQ